MSKRAELEKKFKEMATVMQYFSNKREDALGQMQKIKNELSCIDKKMDELTKEFLELVDKLAKTKE